MINTLAGLFNGPLFNFLCLSGWGRDKYYLVENKISIPFKGVGGKIWPGNGTLSLLIGSAAN